MYVLYCFGGVGGECIHLSHSFSCFRSNNHHVVCLCAYGRDRELEIRKRITGFPIQYEATQTHNFRFHLALYAMKNFTQRSAVHFSSIYFYVFPSTVCNGANVNHVQFVFVFVRCSALLCFSKKKKKKYAQATCA